jgi:uncharacterized protein YdeI (YjbR/CyaY-like superfamily)
MAQMSFENRQSFRVWLENNALSSEGLWLVLDKRKNAQSVTATEALEEALCFGWIDGQIKSIDDNTYRKYFKQRKENSNWSEKNKKLVVELESRGLMTDFGRAKVEAAKSNGYWDAVKKDEVTDDLLLAFTAMLKPFEPACSNFMEMPKSMRKAYVGSYYFGAKTEDGKEKRFAVIVERLNLNLNPMERMPKE